MEAEYVQKTLRGAVEQYGFECYPFKIGWYNDYVAKPFKFTHDRDTLAFVMISSPAMFEKAFMPFLISPHCKDLSHPINRCIDYHFKMAASAFPDEDIDVFTYYDKNGVNQPRVLVQTAGHVSGAAFYYQRSSVKHDPWEKEKSIIGVSIHPRFGGWFGLRGILIFKSVLVPTMPFVPPPDILNDEQKIVELLNRFNGNFRDGTYRDIIPVEDRYSLDQWTYFSTPSNDRKQLIEDLKLKALNEKDKRGADDKSRTT